MVKMNHVDEATLRQYLPKAQNADLMRKDVYEAIKEYRNLHLKIEPFVFNDGSRKDLLNLQGTIPVHYKGSKYNIPICIWMMDTHPYNAPMCFVVPTAEMDIKISMFIDHNGKIYLPYLHDWQPHGSDLMGLIQVMATVFGEQPPVYTKPKVAPYPTSFPDKPSGSLVGINNSMGAATPGSNSYGSGAKPYPPYPGSGFQYPNFGQYGNTPSYPSQTQYPSYPYPPATQPSPTLGGNGSGSSGTITEEHIRASLLSAVEDKLRRRLREQFSQLQAELETLKRTQQELTNGSARLNDLFVKLEKEKSELEKNVNILKDKESELEKEIEKLSDNQSIDVDEAVTTIAPLYKQMLNAFAEEAATEDAIYYIGEGLRSGIIDLETFLKQVRQLSRRQFMLRALMIRCRQKAGLAG